jgi:Protein of unknown function (DUF3500)
MAEAAVALLDGLDGGQRSLCQWPFEDTDERQRWYYTPTDHGGLTLAAMSSAQQRLVYRLLSSGLSKGAYNTATTIMGLENVLDANESFTSTFGRDRGRDPLMYYVRIFGDPMGTAPWSWRFGGHHVSINHVIIDGEVAASTPAFLGANPANAPLLGSHLLRPLAAVEDLGRQLVRSLNEEQRARAILTDVAPVDLVSVNRAQFGLGDGDLPLPLADIWRGRFEGAMAERVDQMQRDEEERAGLRPEHLEATRLTRAPQGLPVRHLYVDQREMLRALLDVFVGRMPDALADDELARYRAESDLEVLSFAWAGGIEPGEGHYYRIQGTTLLAEYDNTQSFANHIHSVWRDPSRDFGIDPLAAHYAANH